jgi:hypothetical protein
LLVVSEPGTEGSPAGLFTPGYYQRLTIPVGVIDNAADAALRRTNAPVRLVLDSKPVMVKSRNVVAQTKTGDTKSVVLAGAHLDSSARSPGINDNGSGVAALLEAASALGSQPRITNAVRFAFWGSEAEGPTKYVRGLARDGLDDVALYISVEMLGSPNAGYFTYDGDQSGQPNPDMPSQSVPAGSAGEQRRVAGYLNLAGVRPADMPLSRTTDYGRSGRRRPGWRPYRGLVATENRSAGAALGGPPRRGVRPELPHRSRHRGQHRPAGAVRHGSGCRVCDRHVRAVRRRRQRRPGAGPAAPEYAVATG